MPPPGSGSGALRRAGDGGSKKKAQDPHRVFAIIGDGEMHEGQIWESLQQASHMKMDNLVAVIDYNGFSSHDPVNQSSIWNPWPIKSAASAGMCLRYKMATICTKVADTLMLSRHLKGKPVAIVAHTVKGSGVSYMENNGDWHSKPQAQSNISRQWRSYSHESTT